MISIDANDRAITRVVESITQEPIKAKLGDVEVEVPRPAVRTALLVEKLIAQIQEPEREEDAGVSMLEMIQCLQKADVLTDVATLYLTGGKGSRRVKESLSAHLTPTQIATFVMEVLTAEQEVEGFFVFTTFLSHRQSRLAPTREVETPSGE